MVAFLVWLINAVGFNTLTDQAIPPPWPPK